MQHGLLHIGNRLKLTQVAKPIQVFALLLVASVLIGGQCSELCAFLSGTWQSQTSRAGESPVSCHREQSPKESQPDGGDPCTHHEIVAEKRSVESARNQLHASPWIAGAFTPLQVSLVIDARLKAALLPYRNPHREALISVLRI